MAKKIILFLSLYSDRNPDGQEYTCPDNTTVTGVQTNDAPVRYLLKTHRDIGQVICIVTGRARETALEYFQTVVKEEAPAAEVVPIDYREGEDFSETAIPRILEYTRGGDEIYLDLTGGFRQINMYMLLLTRVLSYKGVRTAGAVYSNLNSARVEDVYHLIELFDLVGGMQELTSFGSVQTLRAYYDKQRISALKAKDGEKIEEYGRIDALLRAMERLTEDITLCRTGVIGERLEKFNAAMENMEECRDPLMGALLPVFQEKFGRQMTTPGLIRWCVENGMVQQALTIYKEKVPAYVMRERPDLIEVRETAPAVELKWGYENEDEVRFCIQLLRMCANTGRDPESRWQDPAVNTLLWLERDLKNTLFKKSYFDVHCSSETMWHILMDYAYIRALRNITHHASETSLRSQEELQDYLNSRDRKYKLFAAANLKDVKAILLDSVKTLESAKAAY